MKIEIIKLTEKNEMFDTLVDWYNDMWGIREEISVEQIITFLENSLFEDRLPQTFVAIRNGEPVGVYQLSVFDDLMHRHDLYPWLINLYVPKEARGLGVSKVMIESIQGNAKKLGLNELYLYTEHSELYERYGWEFVEEVNTFKEGASMERLYRLEIK